MAFANVLAEEIWTAKYRFRDPHGEGDGDFEATIARVSSAIAEAEPVDRRDQMRERFADALRDFRFIPAGRILAGAGTNRSVTLFNCFVMGTIPDSLEGIFSHLREAAMTMQQGGGVGVKRHGPYMARRGAARNAARYPWTKAPQSIAAAKPTRLVTVSVIPIIRPGPGPTPA